MVSEEKSFEIVDGRTDDGDCLYYRVDTISIGKITKGNNSTKMQVEQLLLISARRLLCFIFLLSFVKLP